MKMLSSYQKSSIFESALPPFRQANKEKNVNCLINSWNIEGFKVFALHCTSFPSVKEGSFCKVSMCHTISSLSHTLALKAQLKAQGGTTAKGDAKILNFSNKHELLNQKLSYLSQKLGLGKNKDYDVVVPKVNFVGLAQDQIKTAKLIENPSVFQKPLASKIQDFGTSDVLNMNQKEKNSQLVNMEYSLETFQRSNQDTCLTHKPSVFEGTWVQSGDLLTDCASSVGGELSLGQNLLIAYMPWEGYNFEDAILISERLVRDDLYTSVHIECYELETHQTKLGVEEITRNIPDVSDKEIQKLDSYGIIKLGSWVEEGDILVGKITPINKKTISPYQKLLYTILEKQVKPIKDSSLRAPKGIKAKVVDIKYFLRKNPMLTFAKSTALRGSTTIAKQEFDKKKKQTFKDRDKTLALPTVVRSAEVLKNRRFFTATQSLTLSSYPNPISFSSKGKEGKGKSSVQKKEDYKQKQKDKLNFKFILYKKRMSFFEDTKLYLNKINKTYFNLSYKTKTLASIPLIKRRNNLIVLNSFLPFLKRLKQQSKMQKSLEFLNFKNLYLRLLLIENSNKMKMQGTLQNKPLVYFDKNAVFLKRVALQKSNIFETLQARTKHHDALLIEKTKKQTGLKNPKFVKKVKSPICLLTNSSDNKQKGLARKSEIIKNMETIHIYLAEKRKIQVGDKMAGRHGNKGIVSQILPIQDMPYLPDGTPIDMVLNPLGVPSRMNVGQIYECLLGLAGKYLGENYKIPAFDEAYGSDASRSFVFNKLFQARMQTGANWLFDPNSPGKMRLYDGRNGECFLQPVTVGQAYILRLVHMVDDKIHARSTGPYSLVTQQPLRGRSKQGGQRLGEMEVWALEGYGAAFTLLEMLTIKSDDMTGRMTLWSNLILNKDIAIGTPESFKVLVCELQALCLDIGLFRYSQPTSLTPSTPSTPPQFAEDEATKQGKVKNFNKFALREINSLINLP